MKKIYSILLIILLLINIVGCGDNNKNETEKESDSAFDRLWKGAPENTLAILINCPTENQEKTFASDEKLVLEETEERFLLIPSESIDKINIWRIEFIENNFIKTGIVYENVDIDDDFVLDLVAMRPEGGPHYQLSISGKEGKADYFITYNGKEGTPNIEYILAE